MKYRETNDFEVLYLISESSEEAYGYIYNKYHPLIKKLALSLAKKYCSFGVEFDDLYQEGMYGLSEAIRQYNNRESSMFFTLAFLCIKREMERLIIKTCRYKNSILNFAVSLDNELGEGFSLQDTLALDKDMIDYCLDEIEISKYVVDLKYELKNHYAPVYELKINGFSNKDISLLLDISYKDVDNYLRSIKNTLRKIVNNIEY